MEDITEEHIEKFVYFPDSLSDAEKVRIQKMMLESKLSQRYAQWFNQFYELLDEEDGHGEESVDLEVLDWGERKTKAAPNVLLAAKSEGENPGRARLKTITTLVSKSEKTLVRVLKDERKGEYRLHLIKEVKAKRDDLNIFHIGDENIDIVIDQSRHVSLSEGALFDAIEWEHTSVVLKVPVGFFKIPAWKSDVLKEGDALSESGLAITVTERKTDRKLNIEKRDVTSLDIRLVVIQEEGQNYGLYHFQGEDMLNIDLNSEKAIKIWLFN